MRKLLSILLLVLFGLPVASPLLAMSAGEGSKLPACCRRNGKHHCMGSMQDPGKEAQFRAPAAACPYCPSCPSAAHPLTPSLPVASAIYAAVQSHPAVFAQTESRFRIARDRSRQKRGPPSHV